MPDRQVRTACRILAVLAILSAFTPSPTTAQPAARGSINIGGIERSYRYFQPEAEGPRPAVFILHGGTSSAWAMERYAVFNTLAKEAQIVAVYPQGLGNQWNDGRVQGSRSDADDMGFLRALAGDMARRGIVDPARIYFAGISNGGMMALRIACEGAGLAAGVAVVAASLPADAACDAPQPLPMILFNGTEDRYVPFAGGAVVGRPERHGRTIGNDATIALWRKVNGCGAAAEELLPDRDDTDGTTATVRRYDCPPGRGLENVVIEGGGHSWPGAAQSAVLDRILGPASRDIDANRMMWDFFERQANQSR